MTMLSEEMYLVSLFIVIVIFVNNTYICNLLKRIQNIFHINLDSLLQFTISVHLNASDS
jgi:hypothetical protein